MKFKALRLTVAMSLALGASSAWALGLGQIEVKSKLNQPLMAEIPILAALPGEVEELRVRLASPDAFDRVGLPRPTGLTANLEFSIGKNAKGEPVVRVTTARKIDEPFLSFLLEADWGRGTMVREFTALLDPPYIAPAIIQPIAAQTPARSEPIPDFSQDIPVERRGPEAAAPKQSEAQPIAEAPAAEPAPLEDAPKPAATTPGAPVRQAPAPAVVTAPTPMPTPPPAPEPVQQGPTGAELEVPPDVISDPQPETAPLASAQEGAAPEAAAEAPTQTEPLPEEPKAAEPATPAEPEVAESAEPPPSDPTEVFDAPEGELLVEQGDTLSEIAMQAKADSAASLAQAMIAIQRANPEAFIQENINLLKRGAVLRIPDRSEFMNINRAEAALMARQQTDTWRAMRAPVVQPVDSVASTQSGASTTARTGARLEIVPPQAENTQATNIQSGASAGGTGRDLRAEASESEEDRIRREAELKDVQARLSEQEQLAEKQKELLQLQNSQLSDLEGALETNRTQETDTVSAGADAPAQPWYMNLYIQLGGAALILGGLLALLMRRKSTPKPVVAKAPRAAMSDFGGFPEDKPADSKPVESVPEADEPEAYIEPEMPEMPEQLAEDEVQISSDAQVSLREQLQMEVYAEPENLDAHLNLLRQIYQEGDNAEFVNAAQAMYEHVNDPAAAQWREIVVMGMGVAPDNPLFKQIEWQDSAELELSDSDAPVESQRADFSDAADTQAADDEMEAMPDDTRIELAKAYIEIGDRDGAKAILLEVLKDGTDRAKAHANSLMKEVGGA